MKMLLIVGLCLMAGHGAAQTVYKCRHAGGAVVYQSAVCAGFTEKQWTATPAPAAGSGASQARAAAERSIERDRQSLKDSNRAAPVRPGRRAKIRATRRAPTACERARLARAAAHERRGVRWSFDDASRSDARVFKACR